MRRTSKRVNCGQVAIGGGAPITIQSMTNTDTRDVKATADQIRRLAEAGCDLVRLAIPDLEAAQAFGQMKKEFSGKPKAQGGIPMIADIHFDYRLALAAIEQGADKVRINPGNIGSRERVSAVLDSAKAHGIPVRIGVNSGSLSKEILEKYRGVTAEGLADSALSMIRMVEDSGFDQIVVSLKASDPALNFEAHRIVAAQMEYPLHIGITESGTVSSGKVKSAAGIGALLLSGIGDTMRVSLTGDPREEVLFAKEILKALGMRKSGVNFISCPTCGRTRVDLAVIADQVEKRLAPLEKEMEALELPAVTVAVMGCEVNGPGEARHADLGIACGKGRGALIRKGQVIRTVDENQLADALITELKRHIREMKEKTNAGQF